MISTLALASCLAGRSPGDFPVAYSADRRTLVTRNGKPFPILGRTAWFICSLSKQDQDRFLDDTVDRGFDAIEFHFTNHDARGNHPPFDGSGNTPFTLRLDGSRWNGDLTYREIAKEAPDYAKPNDAYWDNVESLVDRCEKRGILVFGFPAYVGYNGEEQGWMREMVANGPERLHAFGQALGRRLRKHPNVVWMAGGDLGHFSAAQKAVCAALYSGINETTETRSRHWSAEWNSGMIGVDQPEFAHLMTLNCVYRWDGSPAALGLRAYGYRPASPSFLLEEPYDEEGPDGNNVNPNAIQPVRRFPWWGWLTTIGGYIAGNAYIWPFRPQEWQQHLDTDGARDLTILNRFVRSIQWWTLVPDLDGKLIPNNAKQVDDEAFVATASSSDGSLFVGYFPPKHPSSVDIDFGHAKAVSRLRWMDPTTGDFKPAVGFKPAQPFHGAPPGLNHAGHADWVLIGDRGPSADGK
ncbi:MAG: DUF4038 domain-containing protein [Fimbriimonas sp.]|nr:DUF4038 domain-containing protein [Fimbriimonas sp.]